MTKNRFLSDVKMLEGRTWRRRCQWGIRFLEKKTWAIDIEVLRRRHSQSFNGF
jgi:hypothetical protein